MGEALSIVISAYNEEGNIDELYRRVKAVTNPLSLASVEFIFVDDGSTDKTLERCTELQKRDPAVKIVHFLRNFGHETAMMAGMDYATGDAVVFMDSDLQHPPECIPEMVRLWREGNGIVLTKRAANAGTTLFYRMCAKIFYCVLNVMSDTVIPPNTPDFRLLSKKYIDFLKTFNERGAMLRGMLGLVTHLDKIPVIEFSAPERLSGESKYSFRKSVGLAIDSILQFSVKPLFLSLWLVMITAFFALILGAQVVIENYILNEPTPGYATIVMTVLIMGMVNLIVLTIIGAYIAKIHIETKKRPIYLAEFLTAENTQKKEEPPARSSDAASKNVTYAEL